MSSLFNDSKEQLESSVKKYFNIPFTALTMFQEQAFASTMQKLDAMKDGLDEPGFGPNTEKWWQSDKNKFVIVHTEKLAAMSLMVIARKRM